MCKIRDINFNLERLRFGFVVYGGVNRRDWRNVRIEDISVDTKDIEQQLVPMLRADVAPEKSEMESWSRKLIEECREYVAQLLPFRPNEWEFLTRLNEKGEIEASLLTDDPVLQTVLRRHPGLLWKAQNVKCHVPFLE